MNVLDEVPQSCSHQGNLKLHQTRYTTETRDHESMDSKMVKLLSRVCAFCEEEGHVIMDCPFVSFHIVACIVRHVGLKNVVGALMDQPQEQKPRIHVVYNRLRSMELGSQLGPHSRQIRPSIQIKNKELEVYSHPHSTPQRIPVGTIEWNIVTLKSTQFHQHVRSGNR